MELGDRKVTINFNGVSKQVAIKNANKVKLKRFFNCDVDYLEEVNTSETVCIEDAGTDLIPGSFYNIQIEAAQADINVNQQDKMRKWLSLNKNKVQHALILSDAAYKENAQEFLEMNLSDHEFKSLVENKFGKCRFVIAETENDSTVYIAFRGTNDFEDLLADFSFWHQEAQRNPSSGSFHSGFLEKAELFPLREFFLNKFIQNKTLVFCGHSLGGAVSSIIYTELVIIRHRLGNTMFSDVSNITFGAPLFADTDFREFLTSINTNLEMYHFVVKNDPIPSLLSFGSLLKALQKLHQQHGLLQRIVTVPIFAELVSALKPYLEFALNSMVVASEFDLLPENYGKAARLAKTVLQLVDSSESETVKRMFVPLGNYVYIDKPNVLFFNHSLQSKIEDCLDIWDKVGVECISKHALSCYSKELEIARILNLTAFRFPRSVNGFDAQKRSKRSIEPLTEFEPKIENAELHFLQHYESVKVIIEGKNLSSISLQDCQFSLGFPFGTGEAVVKKFSSCPLNSRIHIEQKITSLRPNFSNMGVTIEVATQFGRCEYLIDPDHIQNIEKVSCLEMAKNASVSHVLRQSIQRAVALAQVREDSSISDPVMDKVRELAELCLSVKECNEFFQVLEGNFDQLFCDENCYRKVEDYCEKIQSVVSAPITLTSFNPFDLMVSPFSRPVSSSLQICERFQMVLYITKYLQNRITVF